jgi:hypothetical protein
MFTYINFIILSGKIRMLQRWAKTNIKVRSTGYDSEKRETSRQRIVTEAHTL